MTPPTVVGFDGAFASFSVAVIAGTCSFNRVAAGNDTLERGLLLLDDLLAEAGLELDAVDAFACGTGPGGFTGLRIALSYAKSIALATGKPLAGVSSFDLLAEQAGSSAPQLLVLRPRAGVFCARISLAGTTSRVTGSAIAVAQACAQAAPSTEPLRAAGAPAAALEELRAAGLAFELITLRDEPAAVTAARIVRRRISAGETLAVSPHTISAEYGEAPATTAPVLAS